MKKLDAILDDLRAGSEPQVEFVPVKRERLAVGEVYAMYPFAQDNFAIKFYGEDGCGNILFTFKKENNFGITRSASGKKVIPFTTIGNAFYELIIK